MVKVDERTQGFKSRKRGQNLSIESLAELPRWVAWREELRDGKKTKIPYDPHSEQYARVPSEPSTWGARKEAERRWEKLDDGRRGGVGIALGDLDAEFTLMGIDLDNCIDSKGFIRSWADEVLNTFDTYAEVSPSQRGVKLFFLLSTQDSGRIDDLLGGKTRKSFTAGEHREIAIDRARFYAVTDDRLDGTPTTLRIVTVKDVRWFVEEAGPRYLQRFQSNNGTSKERPGAERGPGRDDSGSGYGFRFLLECKRRGMSYEAARAAILKDKSPAGEWARRKNERAIRLAWDNIAEQPRREKDSECLLQSSGEFVRDFVPPDYLIDGLLQRRFLYSMTGQTGCGKTSVCLRLAAHVAHGTSLNGRDITQVKVLFLAGENPDDVRQRWIKLSEEMGFDPDHIEVTFLPKVVPLSNDTIRAQLEDQTKEQGPFGLVIVDTSIAYFQGEDENSNAQMAAHARMLRSLIDLVDGGPTVIATCHPTKNPNLDNLLPRGGGAYIAEVDGNLVTMKQHDSPLVELHWHGKFRGPDFAPIFFVLEKGTSERLKDSKGRNIWTITAKPVSDEERTELEDSARQDEDRVLLEMLLHPQSSLAEIARALRWFYASGEPDKSRVVRIMQTLMRDGLVRKERGKHQLTDKGRKAAASEE